MLNGVGMGLFSSPNSAGVMNALPPTQRGAGAGMLATFMNSASVLSIGVFFTLMIVGLASGLPHTLQTGLLAHGVPRADAARISHLPPVATLFASFLGYNPMETLLGPHVLDSLPADAGPGADRAQLLPAPDLRAVPHGARLRVRVRDRRVPRRRRRLAAARRQVPLRRGGRGGPVGVAHGLEPVEPELVRARRGGRRGAGMTASPSRSVTASARSLRASA